jgi:hypothetical protein
MENVAIVRGTIKTFRCAIIHLFFVLFPIMLFLASFAFTGMLAESPGFDDLNLGSNACPRPTKPHIVEFSDSSAD